MFAPAKSAGGGSGSRGGGGVADAAAHAASAAASSASASAGRSHSRRRPSSSKASPPTTLDLSGTTVHFPFRPYDCQRDYMTAVLTALHRGENALLESPTGTGKTLCLLCSALAWQRGRAAELRSLGVGGSQLSQQVQQGGGSGGSQQAQPPPRRAPVILYATRTHSQLSQVVRELRSTRYRPKYAVLGSREQLCVHPKVKTRTATGPDINAGCNRLNKERKCRFRNNLDGFKVPDNESGGCGGGGGDDAPVGGRNGTGHQPILDMEELIAMGTKRKVCPFYLTRSNLAEAEIVFLPYNYLLDPDTRSNTLADVNWSNAVIIFDEAHNLESFASESASFDLTAVDLGGCIGEVQRAISYMQNMPEMAAEIGGGSGVSLDNLVRLKALLLQFETYLDKDIPSRGGSFAGEYIFHLMKDGLNATHSNYLQLINMIRKVSDFILDVRGGAGSGSAGRTSGATPKLDHLVSSIKKVFGSAGTTQMQAMARAGGYRVNITASSGPSGSGSGRTPRTLSYWCLTPSLSLIDLKALKVRSMLVTSGTLSPLPSYALELGLPFPNRLENPHIISEKQVHVQIVGKGISGKQLCSNYGRRDDPEYHLELGNTLATLARLVPDGMLVFFPSYSVMHACIAGFGGPRRGGAGGGGYGADRPGSSGSGGRGSQSGFFAPRRKSGGSKSGAAANSDRFSFPYSPDYYSAMGGSNKTPWSRLLATKSIVLEPRSSSNLPAAIAEFKKYLSKPKSTGAILMGVCRGKISEGIDFADNMCRGVVITGLPFPPFKDDKVRLKREYLDSAKARSRVVKSDDAGFDASPQDVGSGGVGKNQAQNQQVQEHLSGAAWYDQQAHRAVNQAVGRTIRHRNDYGAILLLDSRFADARNRKGLSKWVRPYIQDDQGMGKNVGALGRFFKAAREMEEKERAEATGKIQLQYEEEQDGIEKGLAASDKKKEEEEITRIAVVRAKKASEQDHDEGKSGSGDDLRRGFIRPDLVTRMDMKDCSGTKDHGLDDLLEDTTNAPLDESSSGLESLYSSSRDSKPSHRHASSGNMVAASSSSDHNSGSAKGAFSSLQAVKRPSNPYRSSEAKASALSAGVSQRLGTKRKYPSVGEETSNSSGQRVQPNPSSSSRGSATANGAKKFFDAARLALSVDDFTSVRGALVRMKQHGDKEDKRSYLEAAEDLINILIRYDDELLDLFYPLLPVKLAASVMKVAATAVFNTSRFRKLAKGALTQEDFNMASSSLVSLITSAQGGREDARTFLRKAEPILALVLKQSNSSSKALLPAFLAVVPSRHRQPVQARAEQMRRADEKRKLKEAERKQLGEAAIKVENFRRSNAAGHDISGSGQPKKEEAANPEQLEAQREMEGALMAAEQLRNTARERLAEKIKAQIPDRTHKANISNGNSNAVSSGIEAIPKNPYVIRNPYASARPSSSASTGTSKARTADPPTSAPAITDSKSRSSAGTQSSGSTRHVSKRARAMAYQEKATRDATAPEHDNPEAMDALDQCLKQVKTDVFSGDRKSKPLLKFKQSNVPDGLECRICHDAMKDPLVSDCNHSACTSCWTQWLKKNSSCPVCRAAMTRNNLSRIVFREDDADTCINDKGSRSVPTLSQVVREAVVGSDEDDSDGDSDDGEDELELVAG